METFIKVYIKSEEDLPEHGSDVIYFRPYHGITEGKYWVARKDDWLQNIKWYFIEKPVEIPEISDIEIETYFKQWDNPQIKTADKQYKEWLNKYKDELIDSAIIGAKWYREEQRKRVTK